MPSMRHSDDGYVAYDAAAHGRGYCPPWPYVAASPRLLVNVLSRRSTGTCSRAESDERTRAFARVREERVPARACSVVPAPAARVPA